MSKWTDKACIYFDKDTQLQFKYVICVRLEHLAEALLMSNHNLCFMENWQKEYIKYFFKYLFNLFFLVDQQLLMYIEHVEGFGFLLLI